MIGELPITGRMISQLQITAGERKGSTYLQHSYFTRPFKVADISGKGNPVLHLVMMTASPGILDGDRYKISLELVPGANVHLYTQSYQRIFNMQQGAKQQVLVKMSAGSRLCYLPHPAVPHEQSVFEGYNKIEIDKDCQLIWGEIITCGRKLSGEVFKCRLFQSITEVYRDEKLLFKDVTVLQPELIPADAIGQWEEYTHQAALLWHDETRDMIIMSDLINGMLSAEKGITAGVSQTASGALLVRILGQGGEQLYSIFKKIAALAGHERML
ncbi:urease accessory protein UreD [Chitinophaga oryziterrae]|uniref:Urease accessory protein UreD n=1 Tax=Chitinophaga oryziterrae TaxID=1031224 RepID=A0A6N8J872_9BACT|nr:urease accessory protein UreD [Chitinophaga oryziterrae]MVT40486.1 urease accessory protein UreD [Chitinophaga oryziterrae]